MSHNKDRNGPCWCGSGKKYKKCHMEMDQILVSHAIKGIETPERAQIKNETEINGIRESGRRNSAILDYIGAFITAGITTGELDSLIHKKTIELGGIPAPLQYHGFPKSCCISLNHVVCHGIPSGREILKDGDILNIDVSTRYKGFFSDSSRMFSVGCVSPEKEKLVQTARECMEAGIRQARPWNRLGDVGQAVCSHARQNGCSVVREIGGHGIGLQFHESPWVSYVARGGTGVLLVPGMVFTVEPMINMGSAEILTDSPDGWTVYTADGKPSAQWETTVLVTANGCEILSR